ncbi:MAG TPA: hypothetical protein PKD51_03860 [Saprospiraceae bacterium]|nr:hypothetical protein [Saprospiraceae bacterium]
MAKIIKPLESYEYFHTLDENIQKIETKVQKKATSDELVFLATNGKNPYVKAIAIKVLINLEDKSLLKVFEQSLQSKDTIIETTGCLTDKIPIAAYFFECVSSNYEQQGEDRNIKMRSDLANKILECKPIDVSLVRYLYNQIPPDSRYYQKIRTLVQQTQDEEILFTLAKYENKADIELIKSFGNKAFWAIGRFRDESFLPFLDEKLDDSNYQDISSILTNFCHEKAVAILKKGLNIMTHDLNLNEHQKNSYLINLYDSANRSNCSLYQTFLEDIWIKHKILSFEILENYKKNHSKDVTADFILSGLKLNGELRLLSKETSSNNNGEDVKLTAKLLRILKNLSVEKYILALSEVIRDTDDLEIYNFVFELNDNPNLLKCKADFIQKMKTNESAYGLLVIIKGVKMLQDRQLFNDCFEIIKSRRAEFLRFEVWEESLQDFIKENNLKL